MVRRLVQEQHVRWVGQQDSERQTALLATTQRQEWTILVASGNQTESRQWGLLGQFWTQKILVRLTYGALLTSVERIGQVDVLAEHSDP